MHNDAGQWECEVGVATSCVVGGGAELGARCAAESGAEWLVSGQAKRLKGSEFVGNYPSTFVLLYLC